MYGAYGVGSAFFNAYNPFALGGVYASRQAQAIALGGFANSIGCMRGCGCC